MVKTNPALQIRLTEPVIFLKGPSTGLDFRGRPQTVRQDGQPAMVRGLLTLRLSKPTRIRSITIKLEGKARTEWPEGIGAKRMETSEETVILHDEAVFFSSQHHEASRSRSNRRALSLGPGVNVAHDDEEIDDDLDLPGVPRDDDGDWTNMGRRRAEGRGRNMLRSSSAMPGTHDSGSWHRDGFSRRPSFENSTRSSMLNIANLNMQNRGPSPAYTPAASPPHTPSAIPGHVSRPSSLRQAASPNFGPSRGPVLSPIASAAPSQANSERGDSAETDYRRPIHHLRTTLSSDAVREELEVGPATPTQAAQDDYALEEDEDEPEPIDPLPRPILAESREDSSVQGEVRFQEPSRTESEAMEQLTVEDNEKEDGTTSTMPVTRVEDPVIQSSPRSIIPEVGPSPATGGRAASIRTFTSTHSASSTSLSSVRDGGSGDNHPVNAAVHATSSTNTPAPSAPPSVRGHPSMDSSERPRPANRTSSLLSNGSRRLSDSISRNMLRPSMENLRSDRTHASRRGSNSTIVEDQPRLFTASPGSQVLPPGVNGGNRTVSGASITSAAGQGSNLDFHDDGRGRKGGKFSLAATLRGISRDVKERVQHGRHHSKSRTRMDGHHVHADSVGENDSAGDSSFSSMSMGRGASGSAFVVPEHGRMVQSRHGSLQPGDDFTPSYGRGGAGSTVRESRSRDRTRTSSAARGDEERSRSRARGRHTGLKVLTDKLGLGENDEPAEDVHNWKEFRKGTYNYPISFPIPVEAPPTIHAEFGSVAYRLKATVVRVGALTPNLTEDMEVTMIATPQEDDMEETENVIVERQWEEQMRYQITLGGKAFPISGTIPISIRLMPLLKCKIHRLTVALEEKTDYYAQDRKVARHETPKRYVLLFIKQPDHKERAEPLLPIISDDPLAVEQSPLAPLARQAALNEPPSDAFDLDRDPNDAMYASLMEPTGPWHLEKDLQLSDCSSKIKFTTKHDQTNITVAHWLKVTIRVERGDDIALDAKGRRKQFDIIIETPIKILDCRVNPQWNSLPTYTATQRNFASVAGVCSVHTGKSGAPLGAARPVALPAGREAPVSTPPAPPALAGPSHSGTHQHRLHSQISHRPSDVESPPTINTTPVAEGEDTLFERNIVYDRLMSGQVTETGEVPPTYVEAMAAAVRERSISRVRGIDGAPGMSPRAQSGGRNSRSRSRLRD